MNDRTWHIAKLHSVIFIAIKRPVAIGRNWPAADIRQPKKSLSPCRSFRFINFQRCHRQQPTHCRRADIDLGFPIPVIGKVAILT
jgi:hypothetical protein